MEAFAGGRFNITSLTSGAAYRIVRFAHADAMPGTRGTRRRAQGLRTTRGERPVPAPVFLRLYLHP